MFVTAGVPSHDVSQLLHVGLAQRALHEQVESMTSCEIFAVGHGTESGSVIWSLSRLIWADSVRLVTTVLLKPRWCLKNWRQRSVALNCCSTRVSTHLRLSVSWVWGHVGSQWMKNYVSCPSLDCPALSLEYLFWYGHWLFFRCGVLGFRWHEQVVSEALRSCCLDVKVESQAVDDTREVCEKLVHQWWSLFERTYFPECRQKHSTRHCFSCTARTHIMAQECVCVRRPTLMVTHVCGWAFVLSLFLALFLSVCLSYPLLFSCHFYLYSVLNLFFHVDNAKAINHWHPANWGLWPLGRIHPSQKKRENKERRGKTRKEDGKQGKKRENKERRGKNRKRKEKKRKKKGKKKRKKRVKKKGKKKEKKRKKKRKKQGKT